MSAKAKSTCARRIARTGKETETLLLPIAREPDVEHPGGRHPHRVLAVALIRAFFKRRFEDERDFERQHPEEQEGKQYARGPCPGGLEEQTGAAG
jgi:hypothetical protein